MADYTVTAANVLASAGSSKATGVSGVNLTAGQLLAQDVDGTIKLADANGAAPFNVVVGIALHASLAGQPIAYVTFDPSFRPGITLAAIGDCVIASGNPGNMCPDSDKAAGWFVTEIGRAISTTLIRIQLLSGGIAR